MFRVSSKSFTVSFWSWLVMYVGGDLSLFVGGSGVSVLCCRGWWPPWVVSDFSVALPLEIHCPFRWATPGTLRFSLMIVYLSLDPFFILFSDMWFPERPYSYLLSSVGFRSFSLLWWFLLLFLFEGVAVSEIGRTLTIAIRWTYFSFVLPIMGSHLLNLWFRFIRGPRLLSCFPFCLHFPGYFVPCYSCSTGLVGGWVSASFGCQSLYCQESSWFTFAIFFFWLFLSFSYFLDCFYSEHYLSLFVIEFYCINWQTH